MKNSTAPLGSLLASSLLYALVTHPATVLAQDALEAVHRPQRVMVRFAPDVSEGVPERLRAEVGATLVARIELVPGLQIWSVENAGAAVARLVGRPSIRYAEPDRETRSDAEPDDPDYSIQWNLRAIGAPRAWDRITSTYDVTIAVVDSGIDHRHPDLAGNVWLNSDEIPGNGIDDDRNGFVDDVHGWDFVHGDPDPMDDNGHGTHVAGIIGAVGDNGVGISGVAWSCKLMALKTQDSNGIGFYTNAIRAIDYAVRQGVVLSNCSWSGSSYSRALEDVIRAAGGRGHVCVAAAGNDGVDIDRFPVYPAAYDLDNLVTVAASDSRDALASYSNFGVRSVDLVAPGSSIKSTLPNGAYGYFSGTSMAAPHVAGALALAAVGCGPAPELLKTRVRRLPQFAGWVETGGMLDLSWLDGGRFERTFVTPLVTNNARWSIDSGDWDHDGWVDLICFRWSTAASPTQIHVLSGRTGFQTSLSTTTHGTTSGDWDFQFADRNRDGHLDAVGILKTGTGSGHTEVHIASGADGFVTSLAHIVTPQVESGPQWEFDLADWDRDGIFDLVCIAKSLTGTNTTEVHILSGASSFQQFLLHSPTTFEVTGPAWEFEVADWDRDGLLDLVGLKKVGGQSGSTEVHVASGASGLQSRIHATGTVLASTGSDWQILAADFDHGASLDLLAVRTAGTTSGHVELHAVDMPHQPVAYFGAPCGAPGSLPDLTLTPALIGSTYDAIVDRAVPGGPVLLARGTGRLLLDLGLFGAPGCLLQTRIDEILGTVADATGRGVVRMGLPPNPSFIGVQLFHQFVIPDHRVGTPAQISVSRAGETILMCR